MALIIKWTDTAKYQLDDIIDYLELNWTDREIRHFFLKLEEGLSTISESPSRHKKSQRKEGAYEYQLSAQTTIFYSFNEEEVIILYLWSNRMDISKL